MKIEDISIGVTTVAFSKNQKLVDALKSVGFKDVKTNIEGKRFTREELVEFLKDRDAAIVGLDKVDDHLLKQLYNLKVIAKYGVGLDNIDLQASKNNNVRVLHTAGVNRRSVSEMALGFMLGLSRNLYLTSNLLKNGIWLKDGGAQLSGKTVGIIGVGNIGKDLVKLLAPFECNILLNDIVDISEFCEQYSCKCVSKEELFRTSDFISVHTPLTQSTRNLINEDVFQIAKPNCLIINTARGGIINLKDLKQALKESKIGGAGIDVYDQEPPEDYELLRCNNLINTPHIGGNAKEAVQAMGQAAIDNLVNYFNGSSW